MCSLLVYFNNEKREFQRNSPFWNKAAIEMFATPHFVAMTEFPTYMTVFTCVSKMADATLSSEDGEI